MPAPEPEPPAVVVFAYARPDTLTRTLACLRQDQVPRIYAFCDGPKSAAVAPQVKQVRSILRAVDWAQIEIIERTDNLGLGRSIRAGVEPVLSAHESILVFEDDLVCVPGTYAYLSAALARYRDIPTVMSVTGWTHARVTPAGVADQPYFDGRAESLLWGTWRRAWRGMERDAGTMVEECRRRGIDPYRYGADLVDMAAIEHKRNIWAVRWLYLHILNRGLCLRPPYSVVDHIGLDHRATNAGGDEAWSNPVRPCPPLPEHWPEPIEHPACASLWRHASASRRGRVRWLVRRWLQRLAERTGRKPLW